MNYKWKSSHAGNFLEPNFSFWTGFNPWSGNQNLAKKKFLREGFSLIVHLNPWGLYIKIFNSLLLGIQLFIQIHFAVLWYIFYDYGITSSKPYTIEIFLLLPVPNDPDIHRHSLELGIIFVLRFSASLIQWWKKQTGHPDFLIYVLDCRKEG